MERLRSGYALALAAVTHPFSPGFMKYSANFGILAFVLVTAVFLMHGRLKDNGGSKARYFFDKHDLKVYYERGSWYPKDSRPYTDVFCEYPQVATYSFAAPYLMLDAFGEKSSDDNYYRVFSLLMGGLLLATMFLLDRLLPERKALALLMLLPAALYFTLNRYDIMPALLGVASYAALTKGRYRWSAVLLALGVLAKWYLLLLCPVFGRYYYLKHRKLPISMALCFGLVCLGALAVTVVHSGWEGILVPYAFHGKRGTNAESAFHLIAAGFEFFHIDLKTPLTYRMLFVAQFITMPFAMLAKIDTPRKVILWSTLSIVVFLLCAKFYSPQWMLWLMPFLILWARNFWQIVFIVVMDVMTYLYFPVGYDLVRRTDPVLFAWLIGAKTGMFVLLFVWLIKELRAPSSPEQEAFTREELTPESGDAAAAA